jgi:hypothetical protein
MQNGRHCHFALVAFLSLGVSLAAAASDEPEGSSQQPSLWPAAVMFVTSESGNAVLSTWPSAGGQTGVAAGDRICQTLAESAGLATAGSPAFKAWLSDSGQAARTRMGPGGWVRTDAEILIQRFDLPIAIRSPALYDEAGHWVADSLIWTGTDGDGAASAYRCLDWTSAASWGTAGRSWWTIGSWTNGVLVPCSQVARLLCFQTGREVSLPLPGSDGRAYAFVTSTTTNGDLGLAGADAMCQASASAVGLPQPSTYKAWLSGQTTSALSRFEHKGPWRRIDGFLVARSRDDLASGRLLNAIHDTELGVPVGDSDFRVWTGTTAQGQPTAATCSDWTTPAGTGTYGLANTLGPGWTEVGTTSCNATLRLLCFSDIDSDLMFRDGFENWWLRGWYLPW